MVEATVALVLVDQLMAQYAQSMLFAINSSLQESSRGRIKSDNYCEEK